MRTVNGFPAESNWSCKLNELKEAAKAAGFSDDIVDTLGVTTCPEDRLPKICVSEDTSD